jgi:N-acetylmuramoyl-L-alanine amidase
MAQATHHLIYRFPMGLYRVTSRFFLRLALLLAAACPLAHARAGDWDVVTVGGRQYVTVASLARFYDFPQAVPPVSRLPTASPDAPLAKQLLLDNGKHQILFTLNSRIAVIDGVNQWLGFPVIADGDTLVLSRLDLSKTIEPSLRPQFIAGLGPVDTVVLDPGHGGYDKGAVCIFGNEKDFALDVCFRARKLLQAAGIRVLMTRSDDTFIPLEQRPMVANDTPHSIFVAVHFNDSAENPYASGFEIYSIAPQGEPSTQDNTLALHDLHAEPGNVTDIPSLALSESIYHAMLGNIPQVDRGIKRARFAVLRFAQVPAVLIEGGFVSSDTEARQIATPAYRQELAAAIVTGIEGFKTLAEHNIPPKLLADYRRATALGSPGAPIVQTNSPTVILNTPAILNLPAAADPATTPSASPAQMQ